MHVMSKHRYLTLPTLNYSVRIPDQQERHGRRAVHGAEAEARRRRPSQQAPHGGAQGAGELVVEAAGEGLYLFVL